MGEALLKMIDPRQPFISWALLLDNGQWTYYQGAITQAFPSGFHPRDNRTKYVS